MRFSVDAQVFRSYALPMLNVARHISDNIAVRIEAKKDKIAILTGGGKEINVVAVINDKSKFCVKNPGSFVVDWHEIGWITKELLNYENVDFYTDSRGLNIVVGQDVNTLRALIYDKKQGKNTQFKYPVLPVGGKRFEVPTEVLLNAFTFLENLEDEFSHYKGIMLKVSPGQLTAFVTDGIRLGVFEDRNQKIKIAGGSFCGIIPIQPLGWAVKEVGSVVKFYLPRVRKGGEAIGYMVEDSDGYIMVRVRTLENKYWNYKKVMNLIKKYGEPKNKKATAVVNMKDFMEALNFCNMMAERDAIYIEAGDGKLKLDSGDKNYGEAMVVVKEKTADARWRVRINGSLMLQILQSNITASQVAITHFGGVAPVLIKPIGQWHNAWYIQAVRKK